MYRQFTIDCSSLLHIACRCKNKKCIKEPSILLGYLKTLLDAPSKLKKQKCGEQFGLAFFSKLRTCDETLNLTCAALVIDSRTLVFDNVLMDAAWIKRKKASNNKTVSVYSTDMQDSHIHGFLSAVPIKKIVHSISLDDILKCQRRLNNQQTIIVTTKGILPLASSNGVDAMEVCAPERIQTFVSCSMCSETSGILQEVGLDANKIKYICSQLVDSILEHHPLPDRVDVDVMDRASLSLATFDSFCAVSKHWISEYKRLGDIRNMCRVTIIQVKYICDLFTRLVDAVNEKPLKKAQTRKPLYKVTRTATSAPEIQIEEQVFTRYNISYALYFFETLFEMFDLKPLANQLRCAVSDAIYQMMSLLCWIGENTFVHDIRERFQESFNEGKRLKRVSERTIDSNHKRQYVFLEAAMMQAIETHTRHDGDTVYVRCPRCKDARFYEFNIFDSKDPLFLEDISHRRAVSIGSGSFLAFAFPLPPPRTFQNIIASINKKKKFPVLPWEDHIDSRNLRYIRQELFQTTRWRKDATTWASRVLSVPYLKLISSYRNMMNMRCRISLDILMKNRGLLPMCMSEAIRDVGPGSEHFGHKERVFITKILADLFFTEEQFTEWLHSEGMNRTYIKSVIAQTKGIWDKVMKEKKESEFNIATREWCSSLMKRGSCPLYNNHHNEEMAYDECAKHLQEAIGTNRRIYPPKHPALFIQKLIAFTVTR